MIWNYQCIRKTLVNSGQKVEDVKDSDQVYLTCSWKESNAYIINVFLWVILTSTLTHVFLWILHLILLLHLSRSALMIKSHNVFLQSFSHHYWMQFLAFQSTCFVLFLPTCLDCSSMSHLFYIGRFTVPLCLSIHLWPVCPSPTCVSASQ